MTGSRILIVEDDPAMQRLLRAQLTAHGYEVHVVDNGPDAVTAVADLEPHLLILDIGLPGFDGLEACRRVREWWTGPTIVVSAQDSPQTKAAALDIGADDYVTKPFHMVELLARIRAALRRASGAAERQPTDLCVRELTINLMKRTVLRADQEIHLTRTEFDLLKEFAAHPDQVLTYQYLLNAIWGEGYDEPRLVHVHVCHLRRKIEQGPGTPRYIVAVSGVGYMLRAEP